MKTLLITGGAGFIGYHLAEHKSLEQFDQVVLVDIITDYYDVSIKQERLNQLGFDFDVRQNDIMKPCKNKKGWVFIQLDIANREHMAQLAKQFTFTHIVNLAAQAGVRYSIENPNVYIDSNLTGFANILELSRQQKVEHLLYASSSSVYGVNKKVPFSEDDPVTNPISLYAATKRSNELMAHTYSHLYRLPTTGLRFFTVYGPLGRPDMAYFGFANKMVKGEPIQIFNNGVMKRDFTYVDDIVENITRLFDKKPNEDDNTPPARILNIGNGSPVDLMEFIKVIEQTLGIEAKKEFLPMQEGDVPITWADTSKLVNITGFKPQTNIKEGIEKFAQWYKEFYQINN